MFLVTFELISNDTFQGFQDFFALLELVAVGDDPFADAPGHE